MHAGQARADGVVADRDLRRQRPDSRNGKGGVEPLVTSEQWKLDFIQRRDFVFGGGNDDERGMLTAGRFFDNSKRFRAVGGCDNWNTGFDDAGLLGSDARQGFPEPPLVV